MQFALLDSARVTITSVNIRSEMHGKDHVPALDLKVSLTAPNTMLDLLGMGPLRSMFYEAVKEGAEPPDQPELDGVDPVTDTPVLRSVELEPVKLKHEWTGYTAFIERGARGRASGIELGDCAVGQMAIEMLQGGSCKFSFGIQASGVKEAQLGQLGAMLGLETGLLLEPPLETQASAS